VGVVDHEEARPASHLHQAGISHESGAGVLHADATKHPGRAAGGKPLLHIGAFEMLAGGISGIAPGGLHRYQQHRLRLPGSRRGLAVVVEPLHSSTGRIASEWKKDGERFSLNVTVPPNSVAEVFLPTNKADQVTESGKPVAKAEGIKFLRSENGKSIYEVSSGAYQFACSTN
jgi:hypothetical protein